MELLLAAWTCSMEVEIKTKKGESSKDLFWLRQLWTYACVCDGPNATAFFFCENVLN